MNRPDVVKILKIKEENAHVKTFTLDKKINAEPGQFGMFWLPGVDEKPFTFSKLKGNVEITVEKRGPFTERMFELRKGDKLGIRGPYGNGWKIEKEKNIMVVAGGLGIASLMPIIEDRKDLTVVFGVRTKNNLLFLDRIEATGNELIVTTDDGSFGEHGHACNAMPELLGNRKFDLILSCGPEPMMLGVLEMSETHGITCQLSLERYMRCGIGICGSCAIDPHGLRVCKDGPVFRIEDIGRTELGRYYRDKSGSVIKF